MDSPPNAVQQMTLRAFDLSERTARLGQASAVRRIDRWKSRWFVIAQCAVTAGLAWFLAQRVLGHPSPFFAPVGAIITLQLSFGSRLRRGVEVALGVAVGVLIGDVFVVLFGSGVWQVVVVAFLAMSVATLLGAGQLMIIQAGVQSVVVIGLAASPGQALSRWLDAVIGCSMALLLATIAPSAPIRKPLVVASRVVAHMASTVQAAVVALRERDEAAAAAVLEHARGAEKDLSDLETASQEGLAVVRLSPFRRRHLPASIAYAELLTPLDHASRNLRVLTRRCAVALWRQETVPLMYVMLLDRLADALRFMAAELAERRLPHAARPRLIQLAEASSHMPIVDSLSATVILAQLRSILADLLELTGMNYADARELVPEMD